MDEVALQPPVQAAVQLVGQVHEGNGVIGHMTIIRYEDIPNARSWVSDHFRLREEPLPAYGKGPLTLRS
ncbi:hypothetical protein L3i22_077360 [Actinoplanes sp. L3-i22]|nr:hypothetical protein L3i22_077360 [Actinoplanes sp. L3-i22]